MGYHCQHCLLGDSAVYGPLKERTMQIIDLVEVRRGEFAMSTNWRTIAYITVRKTIDIICDLLVAIIIALNAWNVIVFTQGALY